MLKPVEIREVISGGGVESVLDRMLTRAGVKVLFHARLCEAEMTDGSVRSVTVATVSGQIRLRARVFVDATGNGDLCAFAGLPYRLGREEDGLCQPMTLCFRIADVDCEAYSREYAGINELYQKFRREGKIKNPREDILTFRMLVGGVVHFNSTRIVKRDPTDAFDLTRAELEQESRLPSASLLPTRPPTFSWPETVPAAVQRRRVP